MQTATQAAAQVVRVWVISRQYIYRLVHETRIEGGLAMDISVV